ncbi:hypothetical protein RUND412_003069 [Rhizina undulata]
MSRSSNAKAKGRATQGPNYEHNPAMAFGYQSLSSLLVTAYGAPEPPRDILSDFASLLPDTRPAHPGLARRVAIARELIQAARTPAFSAEAPSASGDSSAATTPESETSAAAVQAEKDGREVGAGNDVEMQSLGDSLGSGDSGASSAGSTVDTAAKAATVPASADGSAFDSAPAAELPKNAGEDEYRTKMAGFIKQAVALSEHDAALTDKLKVAYNGLKLSPSATAENQLMASLTAQTVPPPRLARKFIPATVNTIASTSENQSTAISSARNRSMAPSTAKAEGSQSSSARAGVVNRLESQEAGSETGEPKQRRIFKCGYGDCDKSYPQLTSLNRHVGKFRHGRKRKVTEFPEANGDTGYRKPIKRR